jgi:hypothetical protein
MRHKLVKPFHPMRLPERSASLEGHRRVVVVNMEVKGVVSVVVPLLTALVGMVRV